LLQISTKKKNIIKYSIKIDLKINNKKFFIILEVDEAEGTKKTIIINIIYNHGWS
jgi:hypothetical protein